MDTINLCHSTPRRVRRCEGNSYRRCCAVAYNAHTHCARDKAVPAFNLSEFVGVATPCCACPRDVELAEGYDRPKLLCVLLPRRKARSLAGVAGGQLVETQSPLVRRIIAAAFSEGAEQ